MTTKDEITKIIDRFSKDKDLKIQEFEKSLDQYNKLVKIGLATNRGYCIMSSDQLYNCPKNQQIKY